MSLLFGRKSTPGSFRAANSKTEIVTWFKDFSENPDKYGIKKNSEDHKSMINAVAAITKFTGIKSPLPFFDDPGVPESQRVTAPEIKYRGHEVLIRTIFDVIGWVISVLAIPPGRASEKNKSFFYYPLLTLYAVFCRTLLKPEGVVELPLLTEPGTVQVTWFQEGEVWRVALGGNLDRPLPETDLKSSAKNDRAFRMLADGLITDRQYKEVNLERDGSARVRAGQSFGHCAETMPFTFVQWIGPDDKIKSTIGGICAVPGFLLGNRVEIEYDDAMKKNFTPANAKTTLKPPCRPNCETIVKGLFGVKALERFQLPKT